MSIIRAIKHRLGLSVTPANNFVLDASADNGTMKLARESGQDIMTVDAAGKVAFPGNKVPAFRAKRSTSQTGSVSGTPFKVIFDQEGFDTNDAYNPATGRFQPQVAGTYHVGFSVQNGPSTPTALIFSVYKNGTPFSQARSATNGSLQTSFGMDDLVDLNGTTDYVEFFWTQNTGATMNVLAESYCYGALVG